MGSWENFVNALQYAKGDYIAICEGDDYWTDPDKLQKQVNFLERNPEAALCFHPVMVFFEGEHKEYIFPENKDRKKFTTKELLKGNFIQTSSVMYRRQNYAELAPHVTPGDWYLHLYHARFGKIGFIDETMSVYRRHAGGLWWDAHGDKDAFWQKYAAAHLHTYTELLKFFGDQPEYKHILYANMAQVFEGVTSVQERNRTNIFNALLKDYPDAAERFIIAQQKEIKNKNKKISELHEVIDGRDKDYKKLSDKLHAAKVALADAEIELAHIKSSKSWKLLEKTLPVRKAAKKLKPKKAS